MGMGIVAALALLGIFLFGHKDQVLDEYEAVTMDGSSTQFDSLFIKWANVYGIPWKWLKAICMNESSLGQAASVKRGLASPSDIEGSKSSDGKSWGIMQVTLTTGRDLDPNCTEEKLNNPDYSVQLSAKYLSKLASQFSKVDNRYLEWVIKSYNQGPGNTRKEMSSGKGYADEYWARFQRNYTKIGGYA